MVFYSEGRNYWNVFAPIVKALDKKGVKCVYVTPDKKDPGLQYKSDNVINKVFNSELKAITYMNQFVNNSCNAGEVAAKQLVEINNNLNGN